MVKRKKIRGAQETLMKICITKDNDGFISHFEHLEGDHICPYGSGPSVMDAIRDLFYDNDPEEIFSKLGS